MPTNHVNDSTVDTHGKESYDIQCFFLSYFSPNFSIAYIKDLSEDFYNKVYSRDD